MSIVPLVPPPMLHLFQTRKAIFFALLTLLIACEKQESVQEEVPPNIILILADDLGYNDLSCYRAARPQTMGGKQPTCQTPNLDQMAEEGMLFTQFYAGAAVCSPSRSALITGRNATRVGIYNWIPGRSPMHLRDREITIAEILKSKGYQTGHFGKWHLTSEHTQQPLPNDKGFDYSFFAYNNAEPSHHNPENYFRNGEPVGKLEGYACHLVMDEALQWLDKRGQKDAPFYLNVWFNEPHTKLAAPDSLTEHHPYHQKYYGAIENLDLAVGRLMDYLKKHNLDKNTLVMFTSDNGSQWDYSNDPFRGEKCFNFEGGIREPFIARWPGKVAAGKIEKTVGSFTDVLPTIAAFTGAALPTDRQLDGISLKEVLLAKGPAPERQTPIFFYRYFHDPILMIRKGDWCLLGYHQPIPYAESYDERKLANLKPKEGDPQWSQWSFQESHMTFLQELTPFHFELYNLREDPRQLDDLAAQYPDRVGEMKKEMLQLKAEMVAEGGDWFAGK